VTFEDDGAIAVALAPSSQRHQIGVSRRKRCGFVSNKRSTDWILLARSSALLGSFVGSDPLLGLGCTQSSTCKRDRHCRRD
jgi:hypothetical protein